MSDNGPMDGSVDAGTNRGASSESDAHARNPTGPQSNRSTTPDSEQFKRYIASGWQNRPEDVPAARPQAAYAAHRRARLSARYPHLRLIIPAGTTATRSNDDDYPFRPHSAFVWLTGWAADTEAGSVLVLEPQVNADGHDAVLYFRERADRDSNEFYANPAVGEFWIGARPSLAHVASDLAIATRALADLERVVTDADSNTLVVRDADPTLTARLDQMRSRRAAERALIDDASDDLFSIELPDGASGHPRDAALAVDLSEFRLTKDDDEVAEIRRAIEATALGFNDVVRELPRITSHERGERIVEGVFAARARLEGNAVGYGTIAASGPHACILHWTRNDGSVTPGDLLLVDAGVEVDSLYTADITRTLPVSGVFSPTQRLVYDAVLEAADAAFAIIQPGIRFRQIHETAMAVIARKTAEWGVLTVTAEEALAANNQHHRRYMVHGTSHHLGLDVHDCAQARREQYLEGVVVPGMVFTIEPGLYFHADDLTVPPEFRGIGVRIEDNILVLTSGAENLSRAIPRQAADVEAWLR
jgi:Xaa-Pro aminopeptidase